jgi:hypothetical protein
MVFALNCDVNITALIQLAFYPFAAIFAVDCCSALSNMVTILTIDCFVMLIVAMPAQYDTIGLNCANLRKPDPRLAAVIHAALGDAKTMLNVGAGAENYEPAHLDVTAIEPSIVASTSIAPSRTRNGGSVTTSKR